MRTKRKSTQQGITLIALVITIIVMLILVAVTITIAINGGLFGYAKDAKSKTENEVNAEKVLSGGRVKIGDTWYDSPQDYVDGNPSANQGEISGGGEEEKPPVGQTYTWDKYSFRIMKITDSSGIEQDSIQNIGIFDKDPEGNLRGGGCCITAYNRISFSGNSFCVSGEWTGNLYDYSIGNMYLNYPFQTTSCYVCGGASILYNTLYYTIKLNNWSYGTCTGIERRGYRHEDRNTLGNISKGDHLYGEVTSSDSTEYPSNGFKDGYWYVLKEQ